MTDLRLLDLPAVAESALSAGLLERLPATTPPPPWDCRVRAVIWLQRGVPPLASGTLLPVTAGAFVDYLDSPVGPYREVFAGPLLRRAGRPTVTVPFIAVDSLASVHGGRAHWRLPKTWAEFDGDVGAGAAGATGDGWTVQARAAPAGPDLPLRGTFANAQGDSRADVGVRARGRLACVTVTASGPTLSDWLGTGRHVGVVASGRLVVHPARRA